QAFQSGGKQLQQGGISTVRLYQPGEGILHRLNKGSISPLVDNNIGGNSWNHNDQGHQQLQKSGKDHSFLCFVQRFGSQGSLGDILIKTPITQVDYPHASNQNADSRKVQISVPISSRTVRNHHLSLFNDHVEV